jgi:xeroderma pigmentosum group C-complementing protein
MSSRTRPGRLASRGTPRSRRSKQAEDEIPEVYREMLAEAEAQEISQSENERPAKRFKPAGYRARTAQAFKAQVLQQDTNPMDAEEDAVKQPQIVYNSPSESDESDMEWEEVDIQQPTISGPTSSVTDEAPLQITLEQDHNRKRRVVRRKPVTAAEKKLRLDVHKMHLLCLMCHVQRRNLWCNDEEVQVRCILSSSEPSKCIVGIS